MASDPAKALRERFVKGNLDLIVLKLLKSKPRWGYEIGMAIRDRFKVYLSAGTLYPLLHYLEENGYIDAAWEEGGRGRRIYRITEAGLSYLTVGERLIVELARLIQGPD